MDSRFETACSDQLILQEMLDVLQASLEEAPLLQPTQKDLSFARAIL